MVSLDALPSRVWQLPLFDKIQLSNISQFWETTEYRWSNTIRYWENPNTETEYRIPKKLYLDLYQVMLSLGNFFILRCLMESLLHQLSGSTFIFVTNTNNKSKKIVAQNSSCWNGRFEVQFRRQTDNFNHNLFNDSSMPRGRVEWKSFSCSDFDCPTILLTSGL